MPRHTQYAWLAKTILILSILGFQVYGLIIGIIMHFKTSDNPIMGFVGYSNVLAISFGPVSATIVVLLFNFFLIRELLRMKEWIYLFLTLVFFATLIMSYFNEMPWKIYTAYFIVHIILIISCYICLSKINPIRYHPVI